MKSLDTVESIVGYCKDLVARIKSRQIIESSQLKTYRSGSTTGNDISTTLSGKLYKVYEVTFTPDNTVNPYTQFDVYWTGGEYMFVENYPSPNAVSSPKWLVSCHNITGGGDEWVSFSVSVRSVDSGSISYSLIYAGF